jgi:hypothetical protein
VIIVLGKALYVGEGVVVPAQTRPGRSAEFGDVGADVEDPASVVVGVGSEHPELAVLVEVRLVGDRQPGVEGVPLDGDTGMAMLEQVD